MKTAALTATLVAFVTFVQLPVYHGIAADNGSPAIQPQIDKPFVRSFDSGLWATPGVDRDNPPVLELSMLSWNLRRLIASAFYHNRDSSEVKKVEGRQIVEAWTDGPLFWPYARLEVSNEREGGWSAIGSSPPGTNGTETVVLMYPDQAAYVNRSAPASPTCQVDLTPFRKYIGQFQYGRVVLRSGGASQTIALADLLPLTPSPTPSDNATPSQ